MHPRTRCYMVDEEEVPIEYALMAKSSSIKIMRLLGSKKLDKDMRGVGFNKYCAVPPPPAQVYSPHKKDMSWMGLPEFVDDTVTDYTRPTPRGSSGNVESKAMIKFVKEFGCPKATKVNNIENARKPTVKYAEMYRNTSQSPRVKRNQRNWNNQKSQQLGKDFMMQNKACYNCSSFDHLEFNCNHDTWVDKRETWTRVKHVQDNMKYTSTHKTKNKVWSLTVRPKIPTVGSKVPTAKPVVAAGKGNKGKAVKALARWIWKPKHMTGNISYLSEYEPFNGGYVSFGHGRGKIAGKGSIKTVDESMLWHRRESGIRLLNGVAERRNKTLIEEARTMIANAKLPVTFWDEAVNTDCYVQNRVLVTKPHNKTPYELFNERSPGIGFLRPFRCHVMILITLDYLSKFDAKGDEGYFVGYSLSSKAFRVFNKKTKKIEENLHVDFLENKSIEKGTGPDWLFDIDSLTNSINYVPVVVTGTSSTNISCTKEDVHQAVKENESPLRFTTLPNWLHEAQMATLNEAAKKDDAIPDNNSPQKEQQEVNGEKEVPKAVRTQIPLLVQNLSVPPINSSVPRIISKGGSSFPEPLSLGNAMSFENRLEDFFKDTSKTVTLNEVEDDLSNMETAIQEVYVIQPPGFQDPEFPHIVYKVEKAMYDFIKLPKLGMVLCLNIMFAVCACARHQVTPKECHLYAVKRIFRYLKGNPKLGLWYPKESPFDLVAYSENDYGGANQDQKSTTRGCQFLGRRLISWQCKKKTIVGTSTTKAKYVAASKVPSPGADETSFPTGDVRYGEAFPIDTSLDAGQDREKIVKTYAMPHEALSRVTSFSGEGSMQQKLQELMDIYTSLQRQHSLMKERIQSQELEITQLKTMVKTLEDNEKRREGFAQEDAPNTGGIDQGEDLLDREKSADKGSDSMDEMSHVLGSLGAADILASGGLRSAFTIASLSVATASTCISPTIATASGSFPTAATFTTSSVATPTTRVTRSSRGVIIRSSSLMSLARDLEAKFTQEDQIIREQAERDSEIAKIHAKRELEMMITELDRSNEMIAKYLSEYEQAAVGLSHNEKVELINELLMYQRHIAQIKKKPKKGMTLKQIEEKLIPVWEKMQDFVLMNSKLESKRLKRSGIQLDKERIKKLKTAEASGTKPTQEQQSEEPKELYEEELKKMIELRKYWKIIRVGNHTEVYQMFKDMRRKFDREDLDKLWSLVKEIYNTIEVIDEKQRSFRLSVPAADVYIAKKLATVEDFALLHEDKIYSESKTRYAIVHLQGHYVEQLNVPQQMALGHLLKKISCMVYSMVFEKSLRSSMATKSYLCAVETCIHDFSPFTKVKITGFEVGNNFTCTILSVQFKCNWTLFGQDITVADS
nr:ribonuclease H-like domain-containing protein [Tanacetum cinerariifolium]